MSRGRAKAGTKRIRGKPGVELASKAHQRKIQVRSSPLPGATSPFLRGVFFFALAMVCFMAVFLRFRHLDQPVHSYFYDMAYEIQDVRNLLELGQTRLIFEKGTREPFCTYFLAGLWAILSGAPGVFIQRLGCALIDLCAVLVFYFLGKEVEGKRMGLFLAALGALSQPMVLQCVIGMRIATVPLSCGLVLLASFRLFRNPGPANFLFWGLALAFSAYTYTAMRPWIPFSLAASFLWMVFNPRRGRAGMAAWTLGLGGAAGWFRYYLARNQLGPSFQGSWTLQVLCFCALGAAFLLLSAKKGEEGQPTLLRGWCGAVLLTAVLVTPLLNHPLYASRYADLSIFQDSNADFWRNLGMILSKVRDTLWTVFFYGKNRMDLGLAGAKPFLDPFGAAAVFLGLLCWLLRPCWKGTFLVAGALAGLTPHILSNDPHSGKLMGALVPLLTLAALGMERLWRFVERREPAWVNGLAVSYLIFGLFAAGGCFRDVWVKYPRQYYENYLYAVKAGEASKECPVYLSQAVMNGNAFDWVTQSVLNDGKDIHILWGSNPVYAGPGHQTEKVIVMFWDAFNPGLKKRLLEQFPGSRWSPEPLPPGAGQYEADGLGRVEIPLSRMDDRPGKKFFYKAVRPEGAYHRRFYMESYGLAHGVLSWEDWVSDPAAPTVDLRHAGTIKDWVSDPTTPIPVYLRHTGTIEGSLGAPSGGSFRFSICTTAQLRYQVGDEVILNFYSHAQTQCVERKVSLGMGDHPMRMEFFLVNDPSVPAVKMETDPGP